MSCTNFYNTSLAEANEPPPNWAFRFTLSSEHVWSGFLLYCLLEDAAEQNEYLVVKHTREQKDHSTKLVRARNERIHIMGQPELTHFCDKCMCWYYDHNGKGGMPPTSHTSSRPSLIRIRSSE